MRRHVLAGCMTCLVLVGCGGRHPTAKVSGKVTYQDKALNSGTVNFVSEKEGIANPVASGSISEDGSYAIANAPVGPVKISIITVKPITPKQQLSNGKTPTKASGAAPTTAWIEIPAHYRDPATSNLSYTVVPGDQKHDITLK
jgi:hypothetical protein